MIRRILSAFLAVLIALAVFLPPTYVFASQDEIVTIRAGEIYEIRNLSDRFQTIRLVSSRNTEYDEVWYLADGSHNDSGKRVFSSTRSANIHPNGGSRVIEVTNDGYITISGDVGSLRITQLADPVFFTAVSPAGSSFSITNHSSMATRLHFRQINGVERGSGNSNPGETHNYGDWRYHRENEMEYFGDFAAFSGQIYRRSIDGQRIFPPGTEQSVTPTQPTTNIPPQYQDLHTMLSTGSYQLLFGHYTDFTTNWLDAVRLRDVYALGLTSDVRRAMAIFLVTNNHDSVTDAIMNNPQRTQAIVRDLVNATVGTKHIIADGDVSATYDMFSSLLGVLDNDPSFPNSRFLGETFNTIRMIDGGAEVLSRAAQDYSQNIAMLQSVRGLSSNQVYRETIDNIIAEYQRSTGQALLDFFTEELIERLISDGVGLISAPTVAITSVLDGVVGRAPRVADLEVMIVTDNMNLAMINAFRNAANRIASGNFTEADVESYINAFHLARGMQILRYEAKRSQFRAGSAEFNYINAQLGRLHRMTFDNFVYSVPFNAADNQAVAGYIDFSPLVWTSPSEWAIEPVNEAIAANLVPFELQTNFTQPITRLEFATLSVMLYEAVRGTEIQTDRSIPFIDTADLNAHKAAIMGVTQGTGDGTTFSPDTPLTREQAAVMLARLAAAIGHEMPIATPYFGDNNDISDWAVMPVGQMQQARIMGGIGENMFAPQGQYTIEQSIITIMRLFDFD